ncbi:unnamed protein product [Parajaminaea phylloscopi]
MSEDQLAVLRQPDVGARGDKADQDALSAEHYRLYTSRKFTLQLELINSLSSPAYLYHLTLAPSPQQPAPLSQATFIRYLAHLHGIWSQPQYARFVQYPNGLFFCRLLVESADFRRVVGSQEWENETSEKLVQHWATWRRDEGTAS